MSEFSERLRRLRVERGFPTQPAFARATGVGTIAVNRHENGHAKPEARVMLKYADALRCSVAYLEHGYGDDRVPDAVYDFLESAEGRALPERIRYNLKLFQWLTIFNDYTTVELVQKLARMVLDGLSDPQGSACDEP